MWWQNKLRAIPSFLFENWTIFVDGIPTKAQVGAVAIDSCVFPLGSELKAFGEGEASLQEQRCSIEGKKTTTGSVATSAPLRLLRFARAKTFPGRTRIIRAPCANSYASRSQEYLQNEF